MSFKKFLIASAAVLLLAGCTASQPAPFAMVFPGQRALTGTYVWSERSYQATNGSLSCTSDKTLTLVMVCNDGRKGTLVYTFDGKDQSEHGQITFNDGTKADFFVDSEAAAY